MHYRYDFVIDGYQFSSNHIRELTGTWIAECAYFDRDVMEWKMWDTINQNIQTVRMEHARVPGFNLKVRVTRERKVRDWHFTIFGMRFIEVLHDDYHGIDVFETEDEFMLATPDLDRDLKLPRRGWKEVARDWLFGSPPSPPPSPPQTPPPLQDMFQPPVRIVDPEEPEDEGEDEQMF
ncbi:hypothetical protein FRC10_003178 [Ceratobasidium sp. 414]|nr:hypothetical protein FRC10_003178 [Ceratobasidium sp. 414]